MAISDSLMDLVGATSALPLRNLPSPHGAAVWHQVAVPRDLASIRGEPFEAFELHLDRLWDL